jgi:hypothetical protein
VSLHSRGTASRSSSPATSNAESRADWVVAVDPKSQRKYWYNRCAATLLCVPRYDALYVHLPC